MPTTTTLYFSTPLQRGWIRFLTMYAHKLDLSLEHLVDLRAWDPAGSPLPWVRKGRFGLERALVSIQQLPVRTCQTLGWDHLVQSEMLSLDVATLACWIHRLHETYRSVNVTHGMIQDLHNKIASIHLAFMRRGYTPISTVLLGDSVKITLGQKPPSTSTTQKKLLEMEEPLRSFYQLVRDAAQTEVELAEDPQGPLDRLMGSAQASFDESLRLVFGCRDPDRFLVLISDPTRCVLFADLVSLSMHVDAFHARRRYFRVVVIRHIEQERDKLVLWFRGQV